MVDKKTSRIARASFIFGLIPILGLFSIFPAIILGIIALVQISRNSATLKGRGLAAGGIALAVMWLVVLPLLAMPRLLMARINANEIKTRETVKAISAALENYKSANNGNYPSYESELTSSAPPYLTRPYNKETIYGYVYYLDLNPSGYEIAAKPRNCHTQGDKIFVMKTGSELTETECDSR